MRKAQFNINGMDMPSTSQGDCGISPMQIQEGWACVDGVAVPPNEALTPARPAKGPQQPAGNFIPEQPPMQPDPNRIPMQPPLPPRRRGGHAVKGIGNWAGKNVPGMKNGRF